MVYFVDMSVYLISFLSLIILSYHRWRQLIKPFEETANINRFRIFLIISIWIVCFVFGILKNYPKQYLKLSRNHSNLLSITTNIIGFLCSNQKSFGLRSKQIEAATAAKQRIGQRQCEEKKMRRDTRVKWTSKYFNDQGEHWIFVDPLSKRLQQQNH